MMKLLIEGWKRYLNEQTDKLQKQEDPEKVSYNLEHNYKFISNNIKNIPFLVPSFSHSKIEPEDLAEVTPLKESLLIKIIGFGMMGVVLKLDNGKLLKIYQGIHGAYGLSGIQKENARYQSIIKKTHSGMSYKGELPVYDSGIAVIGNKYVGWAEMGKVLVFKDYVDIISNFDEDLSYNKLLEAGNFLLRGYEYRRILSKEEDTINSIEDFHNSNAIDEIKLPIEWIRFSSEFGDEFAKKMLDAIIQIWLDNDKDYGVFLDLHEGNFGVLSLSDPTPVIFDI